MQSKIKSPERCEAFAAMRDDELELLRCGVGGTDEVLFFSDFLEYCIEKRFPSL